MFLLALGLFVGGYLLQFAGHFLEGTDPGEIIYFKRKLGLSFVEFPRPRAARRPRPSVPPPHRHDDPPGSRERSAVPF